MFQPGVCFTPNLTNPNIRYAFVTENNLTLCEPNLMIGLGSHPAGATKGHPFMHKPIGPRVIGANLKVHTRVPDDRLA
jgi:hypothetical protein